MRKSTLKSRKALESKDVLKSQGTRASLITALWLDSIRFSAKANLELCSGSSPMGSEIEIFSFNNSKSWIPRWGTASTLTAL